MLDELGQRPDLAEASLSAGARQIFEKFLSADWPSIFRLRLTAPQENEIQEFLHGFLIYHLGKFPRGRSAALETI
jgi:hypothetical protein